MCKAARVAAVQDLALRRRFSASFSLSGTSMCQFARSGIHASASGSRINVFLTGPEREYLNCNTLAAAVQRSIRNSLSLRYAHTEHNTAAGSNHDHVTVGRG